MVATREDVRRAAGKMMIVGFEGASVGPELRELLREVRPLGVILFGRNIESPQHVFELVRELKDLRRGDPLLVSVDQEGGRVARIPEPATLWPPMRTLGLINDTRLSARVAVALGRELRALGIDVDFAPVLDVDSNPKNPVIGDRAFSDQFSVVGAHGAAFVKALQSVPVGACGKHFPGHGDTDQDSHLTLPVVDHELPRLREVEWTPFRRAIEAGVGAIMTAHVVMSALDEGVPATLSPRVLSFLRDELCFEGVIISDDVEMKAVADNYTVGRIADLGVAAGIDVFLACRAPEVTMELYASIVRAVEAESISKTRLLESERRACAWRDRYFRPSGKATELTRWVGCAEHAALVQELVARNRS